ncbi:hypothetical protein [Natronomonas pharaonis]|nr:hypothetical protein [Natronomonas pharaonis]
MPSISRRRLLVGGAAALGSALAGCPSPTPGGALEMHPAPDGTAVAEAATRSIDPERHRREAAVLDAALADTAAVITDERPPLSADRPVLYGATVYDVSVTEGPTDPVDRYLAVVSPSTNGRDRIEYEELPSIDRIALADLKRHEVELGDAAFDEDFEMAFDYYWYDEAALSASVLVPDPEYDVIVGTTAFNIAPQAETVTLTDFEYSATVRSDDPAAFGDRLAADATVVFEGLSDDERALVEDALDDGRTVVGLDNEAYVALGERLLAHDPIYETNRQGEWLVEYDGENYWVVLDPVRISELRDRLGDG